MARVGKTSRYGRVATLVAVLLLESCRDRAGDLAPSTGDAGDAESADASGAEASTESDATGVVEGGGFTDAPPSCDGPGARFITDVTTYHFGDGQDFGQSQFPANVLGPPKGGGSSMGSVDVVSLGNGGTVTVAFAGNAIVDEPGPDFLVFENAFNVSGDETHPYAELGTVEVSQDGVSWAAFPCTATAYPFDKCAGWHAVFANPDKNQIDPTDPATAGGDPFDLADVGLAWARFVRVTDRPDDGMVFDLDSMSIVHPMCP